MAPDTLQIAVVGIILTEYKMGAVYIHQNKSAGLQARRSSRHQITLSDTEPMIILRYLGLILVRLSDKTKKRTEFSKFEQNGLSHTTPM